MTFSFSTPHDATIDSLKVASNEAWNAGSSSSLKDTSSIVTVDATAVYNITGGEMVGAEVGAIVGE